MVGTGLGGIGGAGRVGGAGEVGRAGAGATGVAEAVLAFEQVAVQAAAVGVRDAGAQTVEDTRGLVAALDAATAAAGDLVSGPALAACADLLARRVRDLESETDAVAAGMQRAMGILVESDEEVARRVADAAG